MSASSRSPAPSSRRPAPDLRDERGGTLVLFVLFLPVLVLMLSVVLDVGNWFEHRRHLQMQADAAALAAALDLGTPCSNAVVGDRVLSYGGRDYNAQVQNKQANVQTLVNSATFFGQSSPVDTTVDTDPPCTSMMVDVKLTETDLPWYFKLANVPFINAHARVGLYTVDSYTGSLPLAVPDVDPRKVLVEFIDETDPAKPVIATKALTKTGQVGGLVHWDNAGDPLPVTIDRSNIGVRVVVSQTGSTTCGAPRVDCYDAGSANGLVHVRGWSSGGDPASAPVARSVELEAGTCGDAYFNYLTASCKLGVRATLDFGSIPAADTKVTVAGSKPALQLSYDAATGTWVSPPDITVAPAGGPQWVNLAWEVTSGTISGVACTRSSPCKGTFSNVQRTFSGSDARSGPIRLVDVSEGSVPDSNSLERCAGCTSDLVVTVGLVPGLEVAKSINDPLVELRFSGGGSQSQGLDCDDNGPESRWGNPNSPGPLPNFSLFDVELEWGCRPSYTPNTGTACPANASALWSTPNPPSWQCVATQTGQYVNKIGKGLNARVLCPLRDRALPECADPNRPTTCTHPNNWSQFETGLPANDPRIVQLFVTEYGAFDGSGSSTVPIIRFATFYITGWDGSGGGFPNPCQGNGDDPATDGTIVGHFIKYIDTLGQSTGTQLCSLNDPSPCVPVMVI